MWESLALPVMLGLCDHYFLAEFFFALDCDTKENPVSYMLQVSSGGVNLAPRMNLSFSLENGVLDGKKIGGHSWKCSELTHSFVLRDLGHY